MHQLGVLIVKNKFAIVLLLLPLRSLPTESCTCLPVLLLLLLLLTTTNTTPTSTSARFGGLDTIQSPSIVCWGEGFCYSRSNTTKLHSFLNRVTPNRRFLPPFIGCNVWKVHATALAGPAPMCCFC